MLSIELLESKGCKTSEGLNRCLNNKDFYLMLVSKSLKDDSFENLKKALEEKDYNRAFEMAHSLKGVLGNLSLTPLFNIVNELTELLRNRTDMDYSEYTTNLLNLVNDLRKEL